MQGKEKKAAILATDLFNSRRFNFRKWARDAGPDVNIYAEFDSFMEYSASGAFPGKTASFTVFLWQTRIIHPENTKWRRNSHWTSRENPLAALTIANNLSSNCKFHSFCISLNWVWDTISVKRWRYTFALSLIRQVVYLFLHRKRKPTFRLEDAIDPGRQNEETGKKGLSVVVSLRFLGGNYLLCCARQSV